MKILRDKKCLITGAASGIGRATAIATAKEKAALFLTDINPKGLEETAEACRKIGATVIHHALDISDYKAVKAWAEEIHNAHGSLDVLMNIAGISIWGSVENLTHEDWRRCVDINLMGPIHIIENFIPPMIQAKRGGHLVNVSSAAGLFGLPWHAAYSASKFGLRGVSEVLRFDLARHNIGVSLVCPGGVDSGLVDTIKIAGIDTSDAEVAALREQFQKRAVPPESVAKDILRGIHRNKYMVFTSLDVQIGHFFQNTFALPYEAVMHFLNDKIQDIADNQKKKKDNL